MIKIKINEARYTSALTRQAQSIPATNSKTTKTPNVSPTSGTESTQPSTSQQPEQQIEKDKTIKYNNKFYSFTISAKAKQPSWHEIVNGMYELVEDKNLINDLNNFATNKQQVATPVSLDAEDAPTEEAATPVDVQEVSDEVNYKELYEKIDHYDVNDLNDIAPFIDTIIGYLLKNSNLFTASYEQVKKGIAQEAVKIFQQYKLIKNVESASKTIAGLFMENRKKQQIVEAIDPLTGLLILLIGGLGTLTTVKIAKNIKNKAQYEESQNTPEGKYLRKLNLLLSVKFISHFIDAPSDVQSYMSEVTSDITKYMEQFKSSKFKFFGFTQTKLFKKIDEELKQEANNLLIKIAGLSGKSPKPNSDTVNESTIKRWKLLANIK
jgi:hypothetical protein